MLFLKRKLINGGQRVKEVDLVKRKAIAKALKEREKNEEDNPSLRSMSFLYENYQPKFWWFEVFETLRKLSLTGFLVFLFPGTWLQVCISMVITMFSLQVYSKMQPFQEEYANKLSIVAQWQLLLTTISASALKSNVERIKDQATFDLFLTSVQVIPVVVVSIYYVAKRWDESNKGSAAVLPEQSNEDEVEQEEDKSAESENKGGKAEEIREEEVTGVLDNRTLEEEGDE
jgi:hypothetical protein